MRFEVVERGDGVVDGDGLPSSDGDKVVRGFKVGSDLTSASLAFREQAFHGSLTIRPVNVTSWSSLATAKEFVGSSSRMLAFLMTRMSSLVGLETIAVNTMSSMELTLLDEAFTETCRSPVERPRARETKEKRAAVRNMAAMRGLGLENRYFHLSWPPYTASRHAVSALVR